ncbi:hypothetical protein BH10ACT11_BH10ACT11_20540 [soil metagenome]
MSSLSHHSQVELGAIEDYERANKRRINVLDKLRYMRGKEPIDGYDELPSQEIVAVLDTADLPLIKRVRAYERKFANRPDILQKVIEVHHRSLEQKPAPLAPGVQKPPVAPRPAVSR